MERQVSQRVVQRLRAALLARWFRTAPPGIPWRWLGEGFAVLAGWRRRAYQRGWLTRYHPGCPVVLVGSILVGGTGKTPLVLRLAELCRELGRRPGIVSRGHGGRYRGPHRARPDDDPRLVGDEPLLLARRAGCPVVVGRDRAAAARWLRAHHEVDLILGDDGLQHYPLARDLELVVLDERGIGNGACLPVGPLREPPTRLATVDLVVRHGSGEDDAMTLVGDRLWRVDGAPDQRPLASLRGERVHAVAGIGHPARFFAGLERAGLRVIPHAFADHHAFGPADLAFGDDLPVLMTEKDAVKCREFARPHHWYLPVRAALSPVLEACLRRLLTDLPSAGERSHGQETTGNPGLSGDQGTADL